MRLLVTQILYFFVVLLTGSTSQTLFPSSPGTTSLGTKGPPEALPSSPSTIEKDAPRGKASVFPRGTSSHFLQNRMEAAPAAPLPTSSPIRRKSPAVSGRGFPTALFHAFPEGRFEVFPISPSLPTSFPSAGRSLPCRRYWRKPSRSRFCPGSGQPSSSPARNPHRPCRNPFSPPG